jgi:hypothetical protein
MSDTALLIIDMQVGNFSEPVISLSNSCFFVFFFVVFIFVSFLVCSNTLIYSVGIV